jgi:hypothetical protein
MGSTVIADINKDESSQKFNINSSSYDEEWKENFNDHRKLLPPTERPVSKIFLFNT